MPRPGLGNFVGPMSKSYYDDLEHEDQRNRSRQVVRLAMPSRESSTGWTETTVTCMVPTHHGPVPVNYTLEAKIDKQGKLHEHVKQKPWQTALKTLAGGLMGAGYGELTVAFKGLLTVGGALVGYLHRENPETFEKRVMHA